MKTLHSLLSFLTVLGLIGSELSAAELAGVSIIPHTVESSMRYRRPHDPDLGARVQLFVKGPATAARFTDRTPADLLAANEWAWQDLGMAVPAHAGALTVWTFNGRSARWGVDHSFNLEAKGLAKTRVSIARSELYLATRLPSIRAVLKRRRQRALAVEASHPSEREALALIKS